MTTERKINRFLYIKLTNISPSCIFYSERFQRVWSTYRHVSWCWAFTTQTPPFRHCSSWHSASLMTSTTTDVTPTDIRPPDDDPACHQVRYVHSQKILLPVAQRFLRQYAQDW